MGTVRSAVDGKPIPGVRVAINTYGEKDRADLDRAATQSNEAGAFASDKFYVSIIEFDAGRQELISRSAKLAYPIRDGIPIMLPEEARKID